MYKYNEKDRHIELTTCDIDQNNDGQHKETFQRFFSYQDQTSVDQGSFFLKGKHSHNKTNYFLMHH